jgi:hypothetical protein
MRYEDSPSEFDLSLHCPRCRHQVRAQLEAGPIYDIGESGDQHAYLICRCPTRGCVPLFVEYDRLNRHVSEVFPYPNTRASDFSDPIPEAFREDLAEADRCYYARAYKGVVVLSRRVMERLTEDKGAKKGDKLHEKIDFLFSQGTITKSLRDAANEIRFFGNYGAHPRDDALDDVSREDAEAVRGLAWQFIQDIYIQPHQTAKLTKRRTER